MKRGITVFAAFLVAAAGTAYASEEAAPAAAPAPAAEVKLSPALSSLLDKKDDKQEPIVSSAERDYLIGLPEHSRDQIESAIKDEMITSPEHLRRLLSLNLSPAAVEMVMGDKCFLCHTDPETHQGRTLMGVHPGTPESPDYMDVLSYVSDVHFRRGIGCAGCHGGDSTAPMGHDFPSQWPEDADARHNDRSWIPNFCGRCHSDSQYMRGFNPSLPTDQLEKYETSLHGQVLLKKKDSRAAQCVSCHGVHGIQGPKSPQSKIYPKNVPATCASCHADPKHMAGFKLPDGSPLPTNQYEKYKTSVHGRALLERGDIGAPACNDCHGNHAALPPEVSSVAQICRTCHARNGILFDGSTHKQAFEAHNWPECGTCHGKHAIEKTSDAMLAPQPDGGGLCYTCHAKYSKNPECVATAKFFYGELTGMVKAREEFEPEIETFARRGLDTQPMHEELDRLSDSLKQSRSYIHAFERSEFAEAAAPGHEAIAKIKELMNGALEELRFRFRGLIVAAIFIAASIFLLWLKVRSMEKDRR